MSHARHLESEQRKLDEFKTQCQRDLDGVVGELGSVKQRAALAALTGLQNTVKFVTSETLNRGQDHQRSDAIL